MKKIKKISILAGVLCVMALCLSLAACNKDDNGTTDPEESSEVLRISSVSLSLDLFDTAKLSAQYTGEGTLVWATSDSAVVTVDQTGSVTAMGLGSATVSVSVDSLKKECIVTVLENGLVPLIAVNLPDDTCTLYVGGAYNLSSSVTFNGKTYTDAVFTYTVTGGAVSVNASGTVSALQSGAATVKMTGSWRGFTAENLTMTILVTVLEN